MEKTKYHPWDVGTRYTFLRARYFKWKNLNFDPVNFIPLTRYLEKENVDAMSYLEFIFGIMQYKRPPNPEKLIDPLLVKKFKEMTPNYEQDPK